MTVQAHMMGKGICYCGQFFVLFPPEARAMAEMMKQVTGSDLDVFIADAETASCSKCGRIIDLPTAEQLDKQRTPLGRALAKFVADSED